MPFIRLTDLWDRSKELDQLTADLKSNLVERRVPESSEEIERSRDTHIVELSDCSISSRRSNAKSRYYQKLSGFVECPHRIESTAVTNFNDSFFHGT